MPTAIEYPIADSNASMRFYKLQGQLYECFTRQFLIEAGISSGMSVLDVGTGLGDVALIAADLVGPTGRVVGLDSSNYAIAASARRASEHHVSRVSFVVADLQEIQLRERFDAVVGRFVLMYVPNPAETIRILMRHLRPDGVLAFQEADYSGARASSRLPEWSETGRRIVNTFERSGASSTTGLRLFNYFINAGLPWPRMRVDALMGGGPDFSGYKLAAELTRALLPTMSHLGIATPADVDIDTLELRLRSEAVANGAAVILPSVIGAWSTVPIGD